jgi:hypothetical protein
MADNLPKENVSVPKDVWDKVNARLAALEAKDSGDEDIIGADDGKPKESIVRVKTHEGRPITRVTDVVETGIDEITKKPIMKCTIVTIDEKGKEKVSKGQDYTEMRNGQAKNCRVIELISTKETKKGDLVDERFYDEKAKTMVTTGRKVRLAVNYLVTKHVVDFDGETVTLDGVNL